ncbi:MAG: NADH:flavin oxidoreductase [Desulfobacterales bacterium]
MGYDELFTPVRIGKKEIKNRIAFAPTGMGTADRFGGVTDQVLCHYVARAKGGSGLVFVEHTMSNYKFGLEGSGALGFHRDRNLAGMYDLANAIQAFDAVAVVQLSIGLGREMGVGPSPIAPRYDAGSMPKALKHFEGQNLPVPRELTVEEIEELENLYVASVLRTKVAGFDGIEIHGAHGYLLASFLSPHANQRTDQYGGSFDKRLTLALNLLRKSREAAGDDFIIGFRISGDEHIPGGLTLADCRNIARILEDEGIDYIHLSCGTLESKKYLCPDKEGVIFPEAAAIKEAVRIPVICPNFHTPELAANAVREGKVDVVSLCRGLLADPQWPIKVKEGRIDDIQKCLLCNSCLKHLFEGFHTRCVVNPDVGRERFMPEYFPPARKRRGARH